MLMLPIIAAALVSAPDAQLDGWAGTWAIANSEGRRIGHSRIEEQAPQLMVFEVREVEGNPPQPLWFEYSERNKGWTQLFRGPFGIREFGPLSPPGEWPLRLGADVVLRDGTPVTYRMAVTRISADAYRRLLEVSRDKGKSWQTVFDYQYSREK